MSTKQMTFMAACRDFFGTRPNTTALDFGKEIKQLTEQDRKEITEGLVKEGYEILPAPGASA